MIKNIKVQKTLVWALKLMLFVFVLYLFIQQISRLKLIHFTSIVMEDWIYFILVLILLPFNWGFELLKWKHILRVNNIPFNFNQLIRSLFSGISTGIVTPNRLGNFIGRMLFFKGKIRGQLILGTLYSNFAQFLVTLLFGVLSFLLLHETFIDNYGVYPIGLSVIFSFGGILFYFTIPFIRLPNLKFFNKKQNILFKFQQTSKKITLPLLFLSIFRYLIFTLQFLLMFMAFGIEPTINLYAGIFLLFLVSTLTPSLLFGKLIIRETAGLILLSTFIENDAIIIVSSLLLWIVNLGMPSLLGLFFILRKKYLTND